MTTDVAAVARPSASSTTVADVVAVMDESYPPAWAEDWDRVGLVVGEPGAPAARVLLAVDCVPETVDEAIARGVDLLVVHHPLLLRGVHSVATTSYKGSVVHRLIREGIALFVAHTNADVARPGVSDALAARLDLRDVRPLVPEDRPPGRHPGRHPGRIGQLARPLPLADLVTYLAERLPATQTGVRAAGNPGRFVASLAVMGGAGDGYLADATAAGVDAFLTADLRHHAASEHLAGGGPALLDAAHWATERPWLDALAEELRGALEVEAVVSDLVTDVWTVHGAAPKPRIRPTGLAGPPDRIQG
jgi:dinuclear metal center YbgI/SA1388 family protein